MPRLTDADYIQMQITTFDMFNFNLIKGFEFQLLVCLFLFKFMFPYIIEVTIPFTLY